MRFVKKADGWKLFSTTGNVQDCTQLRKIVKFVKDFKEKLQILLNVKLKRKYVKFVKFVAALNPAHKC